MLNEVIVNKMIEQVGRVCKSLGDECWLDPRNGSKCVQLTDSSLINSFPDISIKFNNDTIFWDSDGYLVLYDDLYPLYYCIRVIPVKGRYGHVFGADFMMNKDIVWEDQTVTVYPESKCGG